MPARKYSARACTAWTCQSGGIPLPIPVGQLNRPGPLRSILRGAAQMPRRLIRRAACDAARHGGARSPI